MSDQGYTQPEEGQQEELTGIFCTCWSPLARKIGYYLTFLVGGIIFIVGIIDLLGASVIPLIIGSCLCLFSPLWIKSPKDLCLDFKNPSRLLSFLIFFGFLVATIIVVLADKDSLIITVLLGVCLVLSGIWYSLSYFENGQKACIAFLKTCFGKGEQGNSGNTASSEPQTSE